MTIATVVGSTLVGAVGAFSGGRCRNCCRSWDTPKHGVQKSEHIDWNLGGTCTCSRICDAAQKILGLHFLNMCKDHSSPRQPSGCEATPWARHGMRVFWCCRSPSWMMLMWPGYWISGDIEHIRQFVFSRVCPFWSIPRIVPKSQQRRVFHMVTEPHSINASIFMYECAWMYPSIDTGNMKRGNGISFLLFSFRNFFHE